MGRIGGSNPTPSPQTQRGIESSQRRVRSEHDFTQRDADGNGRLAGAELEGLNRGQIKRHDRDRDGQITRDEFIRGREADFQNDERAREPERRAEEARTADRGDFRTIDGDEDNAINFDEAFEAMEWDSGVRTSLESHGITNEGELRAFIEDADSTGDGALNVREYTNALEEIREAE